MRYNLGSFKNYKMLKLSKNVISSVTSVVPIEQCCVADTSFCGSGSGSPKSS